MPPDLELITTCELVEELIRRTSNGVVVLDEAVEGPAEAGKRPEGTIRAWGSPLWTIGACETLQFDLLQQHRLTTLEE
jgi:hypothetical protein